MRKCENADEDIYYCLDDNVEAVDCANHDAVVSFAGQPTTVTVIGATQTTSTTATPTRGNVSGGGSSHATAIGVGVGVPVGVILLAAIGFLFWHRKRQHAGMSGALPPYPTRDIQGGEYQTYKRQLNEADGNSILEAQPAEPPPLELAEDTIPLAPVELQ